MEAWRGITPGGNDWFWGRAGVVWFDEGAEEEEEGFF